MTMPDLPRGWREPAWACMVVLIGALLAEPSLADLLGPRRLLETIDFGAPIVSPDGKYVAFRTEQASIERNTYDTVWYVRTLDAAPPRRVADGGIPLRDSAGVSLPAPPVWSPDGRWIYYRALLDGRVDVWRAAADGSGAEPLTSDPADVRDFSLSADGNMLNYSVGATREEILGEEQAEYDQGIHIDDMAPIGQPLFRSGYVEGRLATQRFSEVWFDRVSLLAKTPDRWKAIDLRTRKRQDLAAPVITPLPLTAKALSPVLPEPMQMSQESHTGRVALLVRVGKPQAHPWDEVEVQLAMLTSPASRELVRCLAPECTSHAITTIQWRPQSDDILFTVTDPRRGLAQSIFRWNVRSGGVFPVVSGRGLINGGRTRSSGCGMSIKALACVVAEPDRPPRLERIDLETGDSQVLFDPNEALARDMATRIPARLLRWKDENGRPVTGQFFPARSSDGILPPLFVTYYSCTGYLRGGVGDEWPLASMAEHGISALCINYASDSPDAVVRYEQARTAVESVVDLLASRGEIDRTKVGMGGLSFGSEAALWIAAKSEVLSALSVTSPAVSPTYYLLSSLKSDVFFKGLRDVWDLGPPDQTPERWRTLSPALHLDSIRAPVLMQMPEQEYLHALDYAIPLIRRHQADLYVFPNEPHQKFQPRHKLAAYERNLDWFRYWLQGVEGSAPAKRKQYVHWRQMKSVLAEVTDDHGS
ncbi:acylaminoacyl-peptidase [plant metagenome]|uniref:Acylaminoacyl-peptidase n=1 Tax=plant metagenome TaxID=1297885 RepID=A0A484T2U1_9ZZZZ